MPQTPWVTATPDSGQDTTTVKVDIAKNTGRNLRQCNLSVVGTPKDGGNETQIQIPVKQAGSPEFATTNADSKTYNNATQIVEIIGESNAQVITASVDGGASIDKLEFSIDGGNVWYQVNNGAAITDDPGATQAYRFKISVRIPQNSSTSTKTYTVGIVGSTELADHSIIQSASNAYINVVPTEVKFFADGTVNGSKLSISSNTNWVITDISDWSVGETIETRTPGSYDNSFNDYYDTETIKTSESTEFGKPTVSPTSGTGSKTIEISCGEWKSDKPRVATMVVKDADGNIGPQTIIITQAAAAKQLSVSNEVMTFTALGTSNSGLLEVTSNTDWKITNIVGWDGSATKPTITPTSGSGNGSIQITTGQNSSVDSRECSFVIQTIDGSVSKTITVKQLGSEPVITANSSKVTMLADGSVSQKLQISANVAWIAEISEWSDGSQKLTVSPSNFPGTTEVTISGKANASTESRTCTITFKCTEEGKESVKAVVEVVQNAASKQLSVNVNSISFNAAGNATSTALKITSNTAWTIETSNGFVATPTQGTGNADITVSHPRNTGTDQINGTLTIKFADGSVAETVALSQGGAAASLETNIDEVQFNPDGTIKTSKLVITANVPWTITVNDYDRGTGKPTVSPTSGTGSATVEITCGAYDGVFDRHATLIIEPTDSTFSGITKNITVTQYQVTGDYNNDFNEDFFI